MSNEIRDETLWQYESRLLGGGFGLLMLGTFLVALILLLIVLWRGRGSSVVAAASLVVALPLVVAAFGFVQAMMACFQSVETNEAVTNETYELCAGAMLRLKSGFRYSFLLLLSLIVGGAVRAFRRDRTSSPATAPTKPQM